MRAEPADVDAAEAQAAAADRRQAHQAAQQRRLAHAVAAEDHGDAALGYRQGDVAQRLSASDLRDELHVVLDDDDRVAARQLQAQVGGLVGLGVGHPGHRLVEQDQPRLQHQQHPDLEPLLLAMGQRAGDPADFVAQIHQHQCRFDPVELRAVWCRGRGCI